MTTFATNIGTYSIAQTGQELEAQMHGATLNQITDLYGVYNRAARRIAADVDLQETRMVTEFGAVYQGVWDYPVFVDLKGNSVADFFPQANRTSLDDFGQQYNKDFDLQKNYSIKPDFTPRYNNALRTIRINAPELPAGLQINAADFVTDNGTWTASGGASAPINNSIFYTDGVNGSVQTNLASGQSTGSLQNSTMTAVDLTDEFNNNATQFFQVYMPNAAAITSLEFQVGSGTGAYYHLAGITTTWQGTAFQNGWNLIAVPFPSMTVGAGSPVITKINFLKLTFTYNSTQQNQVLINQFYSRIGIIFMMEYYSKYLFRDVITGAFQETVTADTNIINLDTDAYDLFLFAAGADATQQMQGLSALFYDANFFENRYQTCLAAYKAKYKGEKIKPHSYYYSQPQAGYRRYLSSSQGLPPA